MSIKSVSVFVLLLLGGLFSRAQEVIRFTGLVLESDELEPVFGTTILNVTRGGVSVSDSLGFFSVGAEVGDTLLFKDIRYISSTFIIPEVLENTEYGIIQLLVPRAFQLEEVTVYPFPTQEDFNRAFLNLDLEPGRDMRALKVKRELKETLKQAYEQERYYHENWTDRRLYELTGQVPPNHFLDPIRWTNFIRDFKSNRAKHK